MTNKCEYDSKCVLPRDEYRCNVAYEHCIVNQRFKALDSSFIGSMIELPEKMKIKKGIDKLFKEDMGDY